MNNDILNSIGIFILITIISHIYTKPYNPCFNDALLGRLVLFLHDIVFVYISFGSIIFKNYSIHLLFLILILIFWYFYKGRCILHLFYNYLCKNNEEVRYINFLTIITNNNTISNYLAMFILIVFDLYNIYKKIKY